MNAFDLLKDPIKQYIWRLGWRKFFPIQESAVKYITTTKDNYILSSRTASGKTEAAFLPAINQIENWNNGIKILYISPLIALINDQFERIEKLSEHLDIKITKWHGEANITQKLKLVKSPEGILLITPESIEAMFDNHPENIKVLFQNLEFVIIDEIHSFLGTSRGKHLQSLLDRLSMINTQLIRFIGLSATLSEDTYNYCKSFFPSNYPTKILLDNDRNLLSVSTYYFESEKSILPIELIENIYEKTQKHKALIFPNTRGRTEDIAVRLKMIAAKKGGHSNYFAHHASIDRDIREFVEKFAKSSSSLCFGICCTSTLELGIDIGSVDTVVQVDSTFSIASLVQRLGRSGRIEHKSNLLLYATNPWSLLQSIACIELYKEKFIEPINDINFPMDVLLQQVLSTLKQYSGMVESELLEKFKKNFAFTKIQPEDTKILIDSLVQKGIIEKTGQELIIGLEGERIVNKKDFYSLFESEDNFKVDFRGRIIGELPLSPQIVVNENVFLGADIWKIREVDLETKKIFVIRAKDGKIPKFFGSGGEIHPNIRLKMLSILLEKEIPSYLDPKGIVALKELRQKFQMLKINNILTDRPVLQTDTKFNFFSFTGSKINRTILLFLSILGIEQVQLYEYESSFEGTINVIEGIKKLIKKSIAQNQIIDFLIKDIGEYPNKYKLGKFAILMPIEYKAKYLIENYYSIDDTNEFLSKVILV
ncbi:MAG: DEAD/DEAH box helicase [bacterium]